MVSKQITTCLFITTSITHWSIEAWTKWTNLSLTMHFKSFVSRQMLHWYMTKLILPIFNVTNIGIVSVEQVLDNHGGSFNAMDRYCRLLSCIFCCDILLQVIKYPTHIQATPILSISQLAKSLYHNVPYRHRAMSTHRCLNKMDILQMLFWLLLLNDCFWFKFYWTPLFADSR